MHALTATLEAAIRRGDREATLRAVVTEQPCEVPRWSWAPIYGPTEEDGPHAVAQLASGPLVRARMTAAGALYVQRIADPGVAPAWATWAAFRPPGSASPLAGIALASSTLEDRARLFWVLWADGRTIRCAESTDGLAWAEEGVVAEPPPHSIHGLAADMAGGDDHLIYVVDQTGGGPDQYLVALERVGAGTWANRVAQAVPRYASNGIAAVHDAASRRTYVVTADAEGADGRERRLALQELDARANAWVGGGTTLAKHGAASGYDFRCPRLHLASAVFPRHVFTWVESWAGDAGGAGYERPMLCVTPRREWLTEWVPWDAESRHGFDLFRAASGAWYLVGAQRAYASVGYSGAAGQRLDVSADVVDLRLDQPGPMRPAAATLLLDDRDGRYAEAGLAGAAACLRQGSQLALRLGFRTAAGDEGIWETPLWIDAVAHRFEGGRMLFEVDATDAWGVLERLRPALTVQFPGAVTVGDLLDRALWRVTGASAAGPVGLAASLTNAVWQPGRSYGEIARGLCRLAGTGARFRTRQGAPDGAGPTSVAVEAHPAGGGGPTYGYGLGAHPLTAYRVVLGGQVTNHVAVQGARSGPYHAEAHDFGAIKALWRRITRPATDLRLSARADTQRAADALLREEMAETRGGWLDAPLNPAQEVGDTVALTDPRAGLVATPYVVVGRKVRWSRQPEHRATMRLLLEAPVIQPGVA
ncbi:MAG TPA: hypothetical protein VG370_09350 [Chloroflexota bacterium]|nr:hypothetical protein [Chloroflexota bacterium]